MNCLVCPSKLVDARDDYGYYDDCDLTAAPSCEINDIYKKHKILVCLTCNSIYIYCNKCKSFVQLVERGCKMDDTHDPATYAWRDTNGEYHYTTLNKELSKKYNIDIPDDMDMNKITELFFEKGIATSKSVNEYNCNEADVLYYNMCDGLNNDFEDTHKFMLNDLNIYCLNPNDERLIHPDEKSIAICGTGFNILERGYAKCECKHGTSSIDGHND